MLERPGAALRKAASGLAESARRDPLGGVLVLCLFSLVAALCVGTIYDPDLWFHLKSGEFIVRQRAVPRVDVFSYTAAGNPWVDSQWLFQVVLHLFHALLGLKGTILLPLFVVVAAFVLLFLTGPRDGNHAPSALVLFLVAMSSSDRFHARPEVFTLLFIALYSFILWRYQYGNDRRIINLLPVLQVLWVNLHGLFILGVAMVLLYALGLELRRAFPGREGADACSSAPLWKVGLLTGAACLLNPNLGKGAAYPFLLFMETGSRANAWMKTIGELQPTLTAVAAGPEVLFFMILAAVTLLSFACNYRRVNFSHLLICLSFFYLALQARRNISLFGFAAGPVAVINAKAVIADSLLWTRHRRLNDHRLVVGRVLASLSLLLVAGYLVAVVTDRYYVRQNKPVRFGFGVSGLLRPEKAIDFIDGIGVAGNVFTDNGSGSYFLWRGFPDRKVFLDGRWEVYGDAFLLRYYAALGDHALWEKLMDRYRVSCLVLSHISVESRFLSRGILREGKWPLVYFDDVTAVYLRDTAENRPLIDRHRVDLGTVRMPESTETYAPLYFARGQLFHGAGLYSRAQGEFRKAVGFNPRYAEAFNNLGLACQMQGKTGEAIGAYRRALELRPDYAVARANLANLYRWSAPSAPR